MTPAQFKRVAVLDSLLPQTFTLDSREAEKIGGVWRGEEQNVVHPRSAVRGAKSLSVPSSAAHQKRLV